MEITAATLQPAASIAKISDAELNDLIHGERNARRQSKIDFLRGINNLVTSFGQNAKKEPAIFQ